VPAAAPAAAAAAGPIVSVTCDVVTREAPSGRFGGAAPGEEEGGEEEEEEEEEEENHPAICHTTHDTNFAQIQTVAPRPRPFSLSVESLPVYLHTLLYATLRAVEVREVIGYLLVALSELCK
jgi:hypothetical protein